MELFYEIRASYKREIINSIRTCIYPYVASTKGETSDSRQKDFWYKQLHNSTWELQHFRSKGFLFVSYFSAAWIIKMISNISADIYWHLKLHMGVNTIFKSFLIPLSHSAGFFRIIAMLEPVTQKPVSP